MKKILSIFGVAVTIAILSLAVLLTSCNFDSLEWKAYSNSYVLHYSTLKSIWLDNTVININNSDYIFITINHKYSEYIGGFQSTKEEEKMEFTTICEKYEDTFYNRKIRGYKDEIIRSYFSNEFSYIEVVSDADFDAQHPAGTSLKDILRFVTISPLKYIQSGYTDTYDWGDISHLSDEFRVYVSYYTDYMSLNEIHPVDAMLSEASYDDFKLLGFGDRYSLFSLFFTAKPTAAGIHNFTVTLTDTDGQVIAASIEIDFAG